MLRSEQRIRLLLCLGGPMLLGLLTGIFNIKDIRNVCKTIDEPPLTAPVFIMLLLWIIVYIAIGLASYLVLESHVYREEKLVALGTCAGQLLLHTFWMIVFFNSTLWLLSAFLHLLYIGLVLLNTLLYIKIDKHAGYLLFPCCIIAIYFMYLSVVIVFIN